MIFLFMVIKSQPYQDSLVQSVKEASHAQIMTVFMLVNTVRVDIFDDNKALLITSS